MDSVKQNIKSEIKTTVERGRSWKNDARALAWTSPEACARYRALQREAGRDPAKHVAAKAAYKEARRPETGPERCDLNREASFVGLRSRVLLLAYAWYRGRPYASQERTCHTAPSAWAIASCLCEFLPKELQGDCTQKNAERWLAGEAVAPCPKPVRKAA